VTRRRWIQTIRLDAFGDGLGVILPNVLDAGLSVFGPRTREEPKQIGMSQDPREPAALTLSTWCPVRIVANQNPRQPECELLFSDAARSLEEETGRERPAGGGRGQALAEPCVTIKRQRRHAY